MRSFFALSLLMVMTGCIGGSVVERTHFSLGYPLDKLGVGRTEAHPITVLVRRFTSELPYDKHEIVFRESQYAYGYYTYKLWAAKPRKMLQQLVVSHLRESGIVADIREMLEDTAPDYELEGEVVAIEEVNSSEEQWLARLAMRFVLRRYDTRKAVWSWTFDEKRPVPERNPLFIVKSLSEILESQLGQATADLDGRLAELALTPNAPRKTRPKAEPVPTPTKPPETEPAPEPGAHRIR